MEYSITGFRIPAVFPRMRILFRVSMALPIQSDSLKIVMEIGLTYVSLLQIAYCCTVRALSTAFVQGGIDLGYEGRHGPVAVQVKFVQGSGADHVEQSPVIRVGIVPRVRPVY